MEPRLCGECGGSGAVVVHDMLFGMSVMTCLHCEGGCIEPESKKPRIDRTKEQS